MRFNKEITDYMYDRLDKLKRVSTLGVSKEEFQNLIHTINEINGLNEYETKVSTYDIDKYKIPAVFSDFITPTSVKIADSRKYRDLKSAEYEKADDLTTAKVVGPDDFELHWAVLLNGIRMKSDFKSVSGMRLCQTVDRVADRLTDAKHLSLATDTLCVPLWVDDSLFEAKFYGFTAEETFKEWFKELIIDKTKASGNN